MWARIVIALGADKTPLHARSRPTTCREQVRFGSLDRRLEVATLNSTPAGCGGGAAPLPIRIDTLGLDSPEFLLSHGQTQAAVSFSPPVAKQRRTWWVETCGPAR